MASIGPPKDTGVGGGAPRTPPQQQGQSFQPMDKAASQTVKVSSYTWVNTLLTTNILLIFYIDTNNNGYHNFNLLIKFFVLVFNLTLFMFYTRYINIEYSLYYFNEVKEIL